MDWNEIINLVVKAVILAISGLISAYLVPWIKEKRLEVAIKAEAAGWAEIWKMVDKFVAAAEQIAINEGYSCEWKKEYVENMVKSFTGLDSIDSELDSYIESSVILLHNALYGKVDA